MTPIVMTRMTLIAPNDVFALFWFLTLPVDPVWTLVRNPDVVHTTTDPVFHYYYGPQFSANVTVPDTNTNER